MVKSAGGKPPALQEARKSHFSSQRARFVEFAAQGV